MALACRRSSLLRALVLLVILAGVARPVAAGRWYEDYENAVQLINEQGCSSEAIRLLGAATIDKKKPRLNARTFGTRRLDYLPYYQLARAHLACGHLDQAAEYLEQAQQHAAADPEQLAALATGLQQAVAAQAAPAEPVIDAAQLASGIGEARQRLTRATSLEQELATLWSDQLVKAIVAAQPELERRRFGAHQRLAQASARLKTASQDQDAIAVGDARVLAIEAVSAFQSLLADLGEQRQALLQQRDQERLAALQQARATPTPGQTTPASVTRPAATAAAGPAEPNDQVPPALRRAAEQLFRADYEAVLTTLRELPAASDRARAAGLLLRAAARHALYRIGGETDSSARQLTEADITQCRRLDPTLRPAPELFSPGFCQLFGSPKTKK